MAPSNCSQVVSFSSMFKRSSSHIRPVPTRNEYGFLKVRLFDGLVPNDSPSSQVGIQFERQER